MTADTRAEDFTATLDLPTDPASVAALFTSAAGVERWWGPTEGGAGVGAVLVVNFGAAGSNAVRIIEAGPTRVVWEPVAPEGVRTTGHTAEWLGTRIEFDIAAAGEGTRLRFRHLGLTPRLECWDDCFAGWTYFMASIEAYARTGTGTPFGV